MIREMFNRCAKLYLDGFLDGFTMDEKESGNMRFFKGFSNFVHINLN